MTVFRLMLAEILLRAAKVVCPSAYRHHIRTAEDFVHEDYITDYVASLTKTEREDIR